MRNIDTIVARDVRGDNSIELVSERARESVKMDFSSVMTVLHYSTSSLKQIWLWLYLNSK